jgi:hypothetical protein
LIELELGLTGLSLHGASTGRHSVAGREKIVDRRSLLTRAGRVIIGQNGLERVVLPYDSGQFRQGIVPRRGGGLALRGTRIGELTFDIGQVDGKTGLH